MDKFALHRMMSTTTAMIEAADCLAKQLFDLIKPRKFAYNHLGKAEKKHPKPPIQIIVLDRLTNLNDVVVSSLVPEHGERVHAPEDNWKGAR